MISLNTIIKETTPNMKIKITHPSIMNVNNPINSSKASRTFLTNNMLQRINFPRKKCDSCPNAR